MLEQLKLLWYSLVALLAVLFFGMSFWNSEGIHQVHIQLREGVEEHRDKRVPLLQKKEEGLPDYKVSYMMDGYWHSAGTAINQSAQDGITYTLSDPPSLKLVQSLRVSDDDFAEDDHLEEFQMTGAEMEGRMFKVTLTVKRSFGAGMAWFAHTPLGGAILTGITIGFILVVLANVGLDWLPI